jgi:hypothetical protein
MDPVYPKEDPDYMKRVHERFIKRISNTNWSDDCDERPTNRGRKPKQYVRPNSTIKPKSDGKYHWFDQPLKTK